MKKVLLFLMLLLSTSAFAQGRWDKSVLEADELKGIEGGVVYTFTVADMGLFVFWGWDEYQFRLVSDMQFNIETTRGAAGSIYSGQFVHVGLYGPDGTLNEKFDLWLDMEKNKGNRFIRTRNAGSMSNPVGQKGKVKKIFKHLQGSDGGYVRFVCERFDRSDFDIRVSQVDF